MADIIRVLVVDDSAFMRQVISAILEEDNDIKVIDKAKDGIDAIQKIAMLNPDVVTMDVEMPRKNGLDALKEIMEKYPRPVVMVSSHTQEGAEATIKALELGAVDFVPKPSGSISLNIRVVGDDLKRKVRAAVGANVRTLTPLLLSRVIKKPLQAPVQSLPRVSGRLSAPDIIAIGTSTGGPRALQQVIPNLSSDLPCGVVVVQHMPPGFTKSLAQRLDQLSPLKVEEAKGGEDLVAGRVLIAPGDRHLVVKKQSGRLKVELLDEPPYGGHRPSVDVMFKSIAAEVCPRAIGVIMTGMGKDGAEGLKMMREKGAKTIGEAPSSCVVYGMPRVAYEIGGVERQEPVTRIAEAINDMMKI